MPVRNKSASLRASILSLLLPSFNKALRRGSQTSTCATWGCSRSYSHAAQVPSSQVTCNSPRRPWINCRMLLALVSTIDSITSLPLLLRTAITTASLCTSMPIYLRSRLIQLPPWGKDLSRLTESFPQGKLPFFSGFFYLPSATQPSSTSYLPGRSLIMHGHQSCLVFPPTPQPADQRTHDNSTETSSDEFLSACDGNETSLT